MVCLPKIQPGLKRQGLRALDSAVPILAGLAAPPVDFAARHRCPLASEGIRTVLDLEIAPSSWKTGGAYRDS
jgi:hypothetical protein